MKQLGPRVRVRAVEPLQGFTVRIYFDNNTDREVDLSPYLRGSIFEPLRNDPAKFRSIKIAGGTIAWDNGADIDPDVLYYNLKPAWSEKEATATDELWDTQIENDLESGRLEAVLREAEQEYKAGQSKPL
jgi:hypothetical protein